jgi:putative transposase
MVSAEARREVYARMKGRGLSARRASQLSRISRSSASYRARRNDEPLAQRLRAIAAKRVRYGYRRAYRLLRREGELINHKRVERVWRKAGLSLPRRRPQKPRPSKVIKAPPAIGAINQVWSYDFVFDSCANGQKLKMLTVIDEYSRECLAIETATSITSSGVLRVLNKLIVERGVPLYLRSDNGPEFIAERVKAWLADRQVKTLYIEPGSPWQNGKNESFNGKFRDECLNLEWFYNLNDARVTIERWRKYYNQERPHSSLGYLSPRAFIAAQVNKSDLMMTG